MNNKKSLFLFAGILLIVVIIVSFVFIGNKSDADGELVVQEVFSKKGLAFETIHVKITPLGFSPEVVTIKKGSLVTFTNNDIGPHWIASDPHPAHSNLSGFDAQTSIDPGQAYSFFFDEIGDFSYHDHLNPYGSRGTVLVN